MPSPSRQITFLLLLLLLLVCVPHTALAAFTMPVCGPVQSFCVEKNSAGSWCLASTVVVTFKDCALPYSVPLAAHLKQDLSIAYYSPSGQRLGGANYPVPKLTILYICMTARLTPGQYHTICTQAQQDNGWDPYSCQVNLGPSAVSDKCYGTVSVPFLLPPNSLLNLIYSPYLPFVPNNALLFMISRLWTIVLYCLIYD